MAGGLLALRSLAGCATTPSNARAEGYFERDGARLWYSVVGKGSPVILLHGGLSSHRVWDGQIPALIQAGYQVILFDSRGHGRSSLGSAPLTYERMAGDVGGLIARLRLKQPAIVGWSDGAIIALVLAMDPASDLGPLYAFGANMNQEGVRADAGNAPILKQVGPRLAADYAELSPAPDFGALAHAVRTMQSSRLNFGAGQVSRVRATAVRIATGDLDEFIHPTHAAWIARAIPGAELEVLSGCGHFAPWQAPVTFNRSVLSFLDTCGRR